MIGIVLTGHGAFPSGLYESVQLISGEIEQIEVVSFEENQDRLREDLERAIEKVDKGMGVVCLTDLAGGTPFNISGHIAAKRDDLRVIGGVNMPMILGSLFQRSLDMDAFIDNILKDGKDGVKEFEVKRKEATINADGI